MAQRFLLASFDTADQAATAFNTLTETDFTENDVSVLATESTRDQFVQQTNADKNDIGVGEGALKGAVTGGLIGLIVSAVPIAIVGLPSLIVIGPLAAALGLTGIAATTTTGATTGAVVGGLVGALDNLGVDKDRAEEYETVIREGGVLLSVPVDESNEGEVSSQLESLGATSVERVQPLM